MLSNFTARVIRGSGRGKTIGFPTINMHLEDIPRDLRTGIYACRVTLNGVPYPGAMHFGPRPVFKDAPSCEIHLIDAAIKDVPETITVEVIEYVRDVRNFSDAAALSAQLRRDIDLIRGMLRDS